MTEAGTGASGHRFEHAPRGPFSLAAANSRFGGWVDEVQGDDLTVVMTFPVEGWDGSAAVVLRQDASGRIHASVHTTEPAADELAERAWRQALAVLSLDVDGSGFAAVGDADPVIGGLQRRYPGLRPALFHSPYEAAAGFLIGHRISIAQGRAIRRRIAAELGTPIRTSAGVAYAFPPPATLLRAERLPSVPAAKLERLHGVAQAALDGVLDRDRLRKMPAEQALAELRTIPGVGPFFAQGILTRGAGLVDAVTDDDVTKKAVERAYGLASRPSQETVDTISQRWRPYRMWATVLLHVWVRSEPGSPGPRLRH